MRRIGVVTCARSDYSSCLPILRAIEADPELQLHLIVGGMHLSPEYGLTLKEIEADGFRIDERVEMLLSSDTPEGTAKSIGLGVIGFAQCFARSQPDLLLIVGDRTELLAVACAALPFRIPIAHISGGDSTEGAIDNQVRHALTKLSHLHFVAMQEHADRLRQMGEEQWRVTVCGDPALDLLRQIDLLSREALSARLELELKSPLLLVTYHPTTLCSTGALEEINLLCDALSSVPGTLILTAPNSDAGSGLIREQLNKLTQSRPETGLYSSLGQHVYYSLLAYADLMIGNSSSAIWEAPTFCLPAVNVGDRQRGRLCARNVIHVVEDPDAIRQAICQGLDPAFRASMQGLQNPYGDGHAAPRIVQRLKQVPLGPRLMQKAGNYGSRVLGH